ncbi:MAG: cupredoxin family protein [Ramlibacter sp.]
MSKFITLAAAVLVATSAGAFAHESAHGKSAGTAAKKEQKPWGIAGNPQSVKRTVELVMSDSMRFTPDRIEVKQGEVVRIVVRNGGQMLHELVIGTKQELDEHTALMVKFPNMEHDEPYMAHVKPGSTGELVWNFNRPGVFEFACLIAGHYQAGMVGKITVRKSS